MVGRSKVTGWPVHPPIVADLTGARVVKSKVKAKPGLDRHEQTRRQNICRDFAWGMGQEIKLVAFTISCSEI